MKRVFFTTFLLFVAGLTTLTAQVLTMQDGTPARLRLNRTVSSATAHEGDVVDFEVTEPVVVQGMVAIPKGSLAFGHVSKVEPKRRFGRAGELEISVDSVRLGDGGTATLRATSQEGENQMHGGRLAATVAASPVLVWVKGKNVQFERGVEITAYIRGNIPVDETRLRERYRGTVPPTESVQSSGTASVLTNRDIIQMKNAGLSDDVILAKIRTSEADFRTGTQDLIDLKAVGVSDPIIQAMVQKARR
jgi:hypothetical protein